MIAFPGFRDPFYERGGDVGSQDPETRHAMHYEWLQEQMGLIARGEQIPDAVDGPIATALNELRRQGCAVRTLILVFAPEPRIADRAAALEIYAKPLLAPQGSVRMIRLGSHDAPVEVFRYRAAFVALHGVFPRILKLIGTGRAVGVLGPGTPALNMALACLGSRHPERVELAQIVAPRFPNDELLQVVRFDGSGGPDLRDRSLERELLNNKPAPMQKGPIRVRYRDADLTDWSSAVAKARAALPDTARGRVRHVADAMGMSHQAASQRLRKLGLYEGLQE